MVDWSAPVAGHAASVRAFDLAVFAAGDGGAGSDSAVLAAGALAVAGTMLVDELIEDIVTLAQRNPADRAGVDGLLTLGELPPQFANHYDSRFTRKFLIAAVAVTGRLSEPQWNSPASVAEALAMHLVVRRAEGLLVDHGCVDEQQARDLYSTFEEVAFEDLDHEWLYRVTRTTAPEGSRPTPFDAVLRSWFEPTSELPVHPFVYA
ncbi:hypothetical protein AB0M54_44210 [Actinoplanes sp. NPDC051470]|uniref:hypothetical protein n=1 Tax=Actinoplanes sp. NPDC051470 TaxID=3157224 RepID=UPI0034284D95